MRRSESSFGKGGDEILKNKVLEEQAKTKGFGKEWYFEERLVEQRKVASS